MPFNNQPRSALTVELQSIEVRDFCEGDVSQLIDYWYHSPAGFVEAMGIDPSKLLPEHEFKKWMIDECRANSLLTASKSRFLTITYKDKAIGGHTLSPLVEGDYGVFHAHIWKPEMRGKGIARITYPIACRIFMERFNLKRILFKTPIQNIAAIRVKEELGIRCVGEESISFGIIQDGTRAKVFELTRPEAERLSCRH
jgi:RimJ/RimL family protein N-acetyltransferase